MLYHYLISCTIMFSMAIRPHALCFAGTSSVRTARVAGVASASNLRCERRATATRFQTAFIPHSTHGAVHSTPAFRTPRCTAAPQSGGLNGTGPLYAALVAAQSIPFVFPHSGVVGDVTYFATTAVAALVIGCKRAQVEEDVIARPLSGGTALLAPFAASFVLFGSYLLLKYTELDIGLLFNALTSLSGAICLKEALDPLTEALFVRTGTQKAGARTPINGEPVPAASDWVSSIVALGVTAGYLASGSFVLSNVLAVGIIARVLSLVRCESFAVAVALLGGLFLYDIWWVFGSDIIFHSKVMVTVATQIDSPGKLLFPRESSSTGFNYAVLGLGDVFVPGVFVNLTSALGELTGGPYFSAAIAAYTTALLGCFGVNLVTNAAQPALLYLVPAIIGSTLATAAVRGELPLVLGFKLDKEAAADSGDTTE